MKNLLGVLSVLLLVNLAGCSSTASDMAGPAIDLYPVTYRLALQTDSQHIKKSRQEWSSFLENNHYKLLTQPVTLAWTTRSGEKFVTQAKQTLLKLGVPADDITAKKIEGGFDQRFDVQVSVVQYKVVTPICEPIKVGSYYSGGGCYVESARWQSMVRPENTLSGHAQPATATDDKE